MKRVPLSPLLLSVALCLVSLLCVAAHQDVSGGATVLEQPSRTAGAVLMERLKETRPRLEEMLALFGVVVYIVVYFRGSRINEEKALAWWDAVHSMLNLQFAELGAYTKKQPHPFYKDSQFSWKLYASGRRNCSGMLATVNLKQRQDLLHILLQKLDLVVQHDHFILDIPIDPGTMEPFVMAICRNNNEKKFRKEASDIEQFARTMSSKRLPPGLVLLAENADLERDFLDQRVLRVLSKHVDLIELLHFTDNNSFPGAISKSSLRFKFYLPEVKDMHRVCKLVEMAMFFVDRVAAHRLTATAKKKAITAREKLAEDKYRAGHEERQEFIQKRREEALRREEENVLELSAEAQRKYEKRQQKLNAKRRGLKMKMMR